MADSRPPRAPRRPSGEGGAPRVDGEMHRARDSVPPGPPLRRIAPGGGDPRLRAAWHEWLAALAKDPAAALAAADVYGDLSPEGRDAWLDALAEDVPHLDVPRVAIYAPLLAVETDPDRRSRMEVELGADDRATTPPSARALRAIASDGARVVALVLPLYVRFVRVLWCRYAPDVGFAWARHDPILRDDEAPTDGTPFDGARLETTPIGPVIEELAHAVLAHRRRGEELPAALGFFTDMFDARLERTAAL